MTVGAVVGVADNTGVGDGLAAGTVVETGTAQASMATITDNSVVRILGVL